MISRRLLTLLVIVPILCGFSYDTVYKSYVSTEPRQIQVIGGQNGEQFGSSLATGDVNGDGISDIVVGSPFYTKSGAKWAGKVSVFFGAQLFNLKTIDLSTAKPDLVMYGASEGDQFGGSVASGDYNDDGCDDILVGAHNAAYGGLRTGRAYLILGRESFSSTDMNLAFQSADIEFIGKSVGDSYGMSVSLVDINDDNFDDVLIGAPFAMSMGGVKSGNVYGYLGRTYAVKRVYNTSIQFSYDDNAGVVFYGFDEGERFGSNISVMDVSSDELPDVVISAYFAKGPNGIQSGKVYIYGGVKEYPKAVNTASNVLVGDKAYGWFGFSAAGLDISKTNVDGDLKDDLMISSFPYSNISTGGEVFVLDAAKIKNYGHGPTVISKDNVTYHFKGDLSENLLGAVVGSADFDNDGALDIFVGAPGVSYAKSSEEGEIYIFYGNMVGDRQSFDLKESSAPDTVYGENPDDWFGAKATALDFNGDGYKDLAVSSRYSDRVMAVGSAPGNSGANSGKVYILLGGADPFGAKTDVAENGATSSQYITRGGFIKDVVEKFNIKDSRGDYIQNCYDFKEFCFYLFMGQSSYSGIRLQPELILYPDVPPVSPYYEAVNIATMLGIVSGFSGERNNPFKPGAYITRMQALKIILSINQLVKPLQKFELAGLLTNSDLSGQESYFTDIDPKIPSMWWYPRYANYAYENQLVNRNRPFRPDDNITKDEAATLIENTLNFLKAGRE